MKTFLPFRTAPLLLVLGLLVFSFVIVLPSCTGPDPAGLQNATNLSTRLTTLMNKAAVSTFSSNSNEIKEVSDELTKAEEHATMQKRNKAIANQWKILRTEQVVPFLARWKEAKLDKDFVKEAVAQVQKSLDAIKKAEKAK
ncbi:MAG: hypothetical protein ABIQ93_03245 [Saprospiraceae bacterium]